MDQTYLDTLLLYYEEQIEGAAYFAELARAFDAPDRIEKLMLLAEVERHAAAGVAPLIAKYRLTARPSAALVASGKSQARGTPADWAALLSEMTRSYPGYLSAFEALEVMAPSEDRPRLAFLTQHEVAALEFLALEKINSAQSAAPLRDYLMIEL
jgi:hypothetical protein